ncbi:hypothetical protein M422DRAFT_34280 [Sphaerobolus stellatus SS14]|uniref:Uncharacterized protein n=1 Tax=Sphaerobolus stellatus (strain SS14) TaxID=990650 RepID=A0A0C9UN65_SPHS4|nr:hypothetical protein M422DRAFT_34280 [Sphaerobolus stellatus SS14]
MSPFTLSIPTSDQPCSSDERTKVSEYGDDEDYVKWERPRWAAWVRRGEELEELRKWEPVEGLNDAAREEQLLLWMEQMVLLNLRIGAWGVLKPKGG